MFNSSILEKRETINNIFRLINLRKFNKFRLRYNRHRLPKILARRLIFIKCQLRLSDKRLVHGSAFQ